MDTGELSGKPKHVNLRWTSIPSRGSSNTPSRFMLQKLGITLSLPELNLEPINVVVVSFYKMSQEHGAGEPIK